MDISIQTAGVTDSLGMEAGYKAIAQAGFTAIDWNIDHALPASAIKSLDYEGKCIFEQPLEQVMAYYAEELALIQKYGLKIGQAHAPFPSYLPGHPELLEYMIGICKGAIEFLDAVHCPYMVVHGISLTANDRENTPETIDNLNFYLYESLIPTLLKTNVTVCLENLVTWEGGSALEGTCSDPHQAVGYIDSLNKKAGREVFGLCMDVGHLNLIGKDCRRYMPVLGNRIKILHLHDNNGNQDRHFAPMTGTTDWAQVCDSLGTIGYRGNLSFETVRQTRTSGQFDLELVEPWLNLIFKIGQAFKKRIQG